MPRWMLLAIAVIAQIALAVAMKSAPILGVAQAGGILVVGLYAVARRNLTLVTCLCGYLVGSEVLWRQTRAPMFYLVAPYALILLSVFAVVAVLGRLGKDARIAALYVALLLPSIVNTVRTAGEGSRELIAFALAGPLALASFLAFTSQVTATSAAYRRILWTTLISALGPLAVAVTDIRAELAVRGAIEFRSQSNFLTSGGFGPVQVSAVLGLGVLIGVLLTIVDPDRPARIMAGAIAVIFAVQSLLTFSRGGMTSAAIALAALAISQVRNRRIRNRILVAVAVALALGFFFVVPWLDDFTGGKFNERFTDTESSRTTLAANDAEIFTNNIVFGVGAGMTKYQRLTYDVCQLRSDKCSQEASSHTEFTRMLGEHGIPGVVAIVLMATLAVRAIRSRGQGRPFAPAFIAWAVAQMFYANMRVVAVPFAFGLAFLTIRDDPGDDEDVGEEADDPDATGAAPGIPGPVDPTAPAPPGWTPAPTAGPAGAPVGGAAGAPLGGPAPGWWSG